MRRYAAELIGTFILVFAGTGAVVIDDVTHEGVSHVGIALTFGLVVMAVIYAIGDVSGAHINPAVTFGFWIARRFETRDVLPYLAAQLAGASLASVSLRLMFGNRAALGCTLPLETWGQSFVLEVILTAILMFVIFCVASGSKETGIMAGAAIGAVVALEALFAGPISGASMNPARSLGPALVSGTWTDQWIYVVAPVLGAAVGWGGFLVIHEPRQTES